MHLLNRREFSGLCAALGSLAAFDAASRAASAAEGRTVKFRDGAVVPALGQGSANLGKGRRPQAEEEEALRTGISLGMTLIDTAEIYGSEEFIGRGISGQRERIFLVSKVWPNHVAGTASRALARQASSASAPTISISISCIAEWRHQRRARREHVRKIALSGKDLRLGCLQLQGQRHGKSLPRSARRSLRHQSTSLQHRRPRHRARCAAMVPTAWNADHGLFTPRRPRGQSAARSHFGTYRRSAWLLCGCRCPGLGHRQRQRHSDSRIRFGGACEGERRRAVPDIDARRHSNAGIGASAAKALG